MDGRHQEGKELLQNALAAAPLNEVVSFDKDA